MKHSKKKKKSKKHQWNNQLLKTSCISKITLLHHLKYCKWAKKSKMDPVICTASTMCSLPHKQMIQTSFISFSFIFILFSDAIMLVERQKGPWSYNSAFLSFHESTSSFSRHFWCKHLMLAPETNIAKYGVSSPKKHYCFPPCTVCLPTHSR